MQLDWTTLALEIVNFLVLLWLLTRFLYRPVAAALAQRRAALEREMREAHEAQAQAVALRTQYENRQAAWERERDAARARLREEVEAERGRRLAELREALERERQRRQALDEREAAHRADALEREALRQASAFASRLLAGLAGPEIETRIVDMALAELAALPAARRAALQAAAREGAAAGVASAYPLSSAQQQGLSAAMAEAAGKPLGAKFATDASLLAGLRIELGPWVLGANLRDELAAFAESANAPA